MLHALGRCTPPPWAMRYSVHLPHGTWRGACSPRDVPPVGRYTRKALSPRRPLPRGRTPAVPLRKAVAVAVAATVRLNGVGGP